MDKNNLIILITIHVRSLFLYHTQIFIFNVIVVNQNTKVGTEKIVLERAQFRNKIHFISIKTNNNRIKFLKWSRRSPRRRPMIHQYIPALNLKRHFDRLNLFF